MLAALGERWGGEGEREAEDRRGGGAPRAAVAKVPARRERDVDGAPHQILGEVEQQVERGGGAHAPARVNRGGEYPRTHGWLVDLRAARTENGAPTAQVNDSGSTCAGGHAMGVSRKCNQGPHAVDGTALRCVGAAAGDRLMLYGGGWGGVGGGAAGPFH